MKRPYIVVKVAATVDGRIAIAPDITMWEEMADARTHSEGSEKLWGEVEDTIKKLHKPQADMLGSNSLIKEDEELRTLPQFEGNPEHLFKDYLPENVIKRENQKGWLVVVDGRGRLRSGYKGDENLEQHMLHLVSNSVPADYLAFLQSREIPYLISGERQVDLKDAMEKLALKLGVNCLVTSAGGKLSGALLRAGLVDEVNILVKPFLYGGTATPSLFDSEDLKFDELPTRLQLLECKSEPNGHVWLRYKVNK